MGVPAPDQVAFAVSGPITRADLPGLCNRVCTFLHERGPGEVLCDVSTVHANAVTVDALARLQLAACRNGNRVRLCNASAELLQLVAFLGLADVVTT